MSKIIKIYKYCADIIRLPTLQAALTPFNHLRCKKVLSSLITSLKKVMVCIILIMEKNCDAYTTSYITVIVFGRI